ncbi:unnamed protein product [Pedinophyceae sp. YPF-701]|nr:unnamed protein product [Pedinophyceae sp. YPF-701]
MRFQGTFLLLALVVAVAGPWVARAGSLTIRESIRASNSEHSILYGDDARLSNEHVHARQVDGAAHGAGMRPMPRALVQGAFAKRFLQAGDAGGDDGESGRTPSELVEICHDVLVDRNWRHILAQEMPATVFVLALGLLLIIGARYEGSQRRLLNLAKGRGPPNVGRSVTIVVTDVEGSTELWEELPEAMSSANEIHDATLRAYLGLYKGYECYTEGDSFVLAFHEPYDAIAYCLTVQQALFAAQWPEQILNHPRAQSHVSMPFRGLSVRMVAATGMATNRQRHHVTRRFEYTGQVMEVAKELADYAHGGQIICDNPTMVGIADQLERLFSTLETSRDLTALDKGNVQLILQGMADAGVVPNRRWLKTEGEDTTHSSRPDKSVTVPQEVAAEVQSQLRAGKQSRKKLRVRIASPDMESSPDPESQLATLAGLPSTGDDLLASAAKALESSGSSGGLAPSTSGGSDSAMSGPQRLATDSAGEPIDPDGTASVAVAPAKSPSRDEARRAGGFLEFRATSASGQAPARAASSRGRFRSMMVGKRDAKTARRSMELPGPEERVRENEKRYRKRTAHLARIDLRTMLQGRTLERLQVASPQGDTAGGARLHGGGGRPMPSTQQLYKTSSHSAAIVNAVDTRQLETASSAGMEFAREIAEHLAASDVNIGLNLSTVAEAPMEGSMTNTLGGTGPEEGSSEVAAARSASPAKDLHALEEHAMGSQHEAPRGAPVEDGEAEKTPGATRPQMAPAVLAQAAAVQRGKTLMALATSKARAKAMVGQQLRQKTKVSNVVKALAKAEDQRHELLRLQKSISGQVKGQVTVLDMGVYHLNCRAKFQGGNASGLDDGITVAQQRQRARENVFQVLVPYMEARAHSFPPLAMRQVGPGYPDAPGAMDALIKQTYSVCPHGVDLQACADCLEHGTTLNDIDCGNALPNVTICFCTPCCVDRLTARAIGLADVCMEIYSQIVRSTLLEFWGYECQDLDGAFMIAFHDPGRAIQWAIRLQEALVQAPWPEALMDIPGFEVELDKYGKLLFRGLTVKIGIFEGRPVKVEPHKITGRADYFGPLVNRAARLCFGLAQAGSIMMDKTTATRGMQSLLASGLAVKGVDGPDHPGRAAMRVRYSSLPTTSGGASNGAISAVASIYGMQTPTSMGAYGQTATMMAASKICHVVDAGTVAFKGVQEPLECVMVSGGDLIGRFQGKDLKMGKKAEIVRRGSGAPEVWWLVSAANPGTGTDSNFRHTIEPSDGHSHLQMSQPDILRTSSVNAKEDDMPAAGETPRTPTMVIHNNAFIGSSRSETGNDGRAEEQEHDEDWRRNEV